MISTMCRWEVELRLVTSPTLHFFTLLVLPARNLFHSRVFAIILKSWLKRWCESSWRQRPHLRIVQRLRLWREWQKSGSRDRFYVRSRRTSGFSPPFPFNLSKGSPTFVQVGRDCIYQFMWQSKYACAMDANSANAKVIVFLFPLWFPGENLWSTACFHLGKSMLLPPQLSPATFHANEWWELADRRGNGEGTWNVFVVAVWTAFVEFFASLQWRCFRVFGIADWGNVGCTWIGVWTAGWIKNNRFASHPTTHFLLFVWNSC